MGRRFVALLPLPTTTMLLLSYLFPTTYAQLGLPEVPGLDLEGCYANMVKADSDNNGFLTAGEFSQLAALQADEKNCFTPAPDGELTESQLGSFSGLACSSCMANGDGGGLCCLRPAEQRRIAITGAGSLTERSFVQETSLTTICTALSLYILTPGCESEPGSIGSIMPDLANLAGVGFPFPVDIPFGNQEECFVDLQAADQDDDGYLNVSEFYDLLVLQGKEGCSSEGSLSLLHANTFRGLACGSCRIYFDGGDDCCSRGLDEARISVHGAASKDGRTNVQEGTLTAICTLLDLPFSSTDCDEQVELPGLPPDGLGDDDDVILQGCYDNLVTADEDGDSFLSAAEFRQLLILSGGEDCYKDKTLNRQQTFAFLGLACGACLVEGHGLSKCCTENIAENKISIAGAASREGRNGLQEGALAVTCTTVVADALLSCGGGEVQWQPSTPPITVEDVEVGDQQKCFEDMAAADVNGDTYVDVYEFYKLLVDEHCVTSGKLTEDQIETFMGVTCASCMVSGDGGGLCCSRALDESRFSVTGAVAQTKSASAAEVGALVLICRTLEKKVLSACDGKLSAPNEPADNPPDDPTPAVPAPETPADGDNPIPAPAPETPADGENQVPVPAPETPTDGENQVPAPAPETPAGDNPVAAPAPETPAGDNPVPVPASETPDNGDNQVPAPAPETPADEENQVSAPAPETLPADGENQVPAPAPETPAGDNPVAAPAPETPADDNPVPVPASETPANGDNQVPAPAPETPTDEENQVSAPAPETLPADGENQVPAPAPETPAGDNPVPAPAPETQPGDNPVPAPAPETQPGDNPVPAPAPETPAGDNPVPAPAPETPDGDGPGPAPVPETPSAEMPAPAPETPVDGNGDTTIDAISQEISSSSKLGTPSSLSVGVGLAALLVATILPC